MTFYIARVIMIPPHSQTNEIDKARADIQEVTLKVTGLVIGQTKICCIFTRDGRKILDIHLKNVT